MTEDLKRLVDERLRAVLAQLGELEPCDLAARLTEIVPELVDRRAAHAFVERAFELYRDSHVDLEIEPQTLPYARIEPLQGAGRFIDNADSDQPTVDLSGYRIRNA